MFLVYLILASVGASIVQRVSGFGFGIFIMTILPFIMPSYAEATALSGILAALQSAVVVFQYYKNIRVARLIPILSAFLVTSCIGIWLIEYIDEGEMKRILGGLLVLLSIYFLIFSEKIKFHPMMGWQVSLGGISGLMGGLFAMQGPPAVLYFANAERRKEHYIAHVQAYFLVGNIFMTFVRGYNGYVTEFVWESAVYALVGVAVGTIVGGYLFDKVSAKMLRRIVYAFMAISGLYAMLM